MSASATRPAPQPTDARRQRRIAELSARVASGTYEVPGGLVAAAIIAEAATWRRLRRSRFAT